MKKFCSVFLSVLLFLVITTTAAAQAPTTANSASPRPLLPQKPAAVKELRQEIKEKTIDKLKTAREERLNILETAREAAKEKFKEKRGAFMEKKEAIKDAKKKAVVERIDQKMADVNKRRTDQMNETLTRLSDLLDKLQERVDKAKTNGKDTAGTVEPIAKAREAIIAAQTAVTAQAGKEYVATISEETKLKADVGTAVKSLEKDLKVTHQTVLAAKKAVSDALKSVKTIKGVDDGTSPSPTAATNE